MKLRLNSLTSGGSRHPARQRLIWIILAITVLLGAYFRLARLGVPALYMDNQDFLTPCREGLSFSQIFSHWQELPTGKNHLPFPVAVTAWVVQTFGLTLTFASLILPSALWGVLMIPVAFAIGRELRGRGLGLVLAGIVAMNPICIQLSRLAYYYSPALLGSFLSLWAVLLFFRPSKRESLPWEFHVVAPLSAFLMWYSDPSVWPYSGMVLLLFMGVLGYRFLRYRQGGRDLLLLVILFGAIGLPVTFSSWGIASVVKATLTLSPEDNAYWKLVFWNVESPWPKLWPMLKSYAWGTTPFRSCFAVLVIASGMAYALWNARRDRRYGLLLGLLGAALGVTILALSRTIAGFSHARIVAAVPMYLALLALGLTAPAELAVRWRWGARVGPAVTWLAIAAAAALAVWPAWLCTRVLGRPVPYKAAVAWLDAHLPPQTPILTERFFDAYNEFRVHPATNVIFMSTVRNQVPPEYLGNRFRERSEAFLSNNPVSGVYQTRMLWERPEVGPWTWPDRFYARRIVVTNEAALALHRLGLNNDTAIGDPASELSCKSTVLYNLPEDVVDRARREGKPFVAFFGPNWGYTKTQDYRDWRVLTGRATIEIHNLASTTTNVTLVVNAVAVGVTARVRASTGAEHLFPVGQLHEWRIPGVVLQPGSNTVAIARVGRDAPNAAVLVEKLSLE